MSNKVSNLSNVLFAILASVIFATNLFSASITSTYWVLVLGLLVLLIWMLILTARKAIKNKKQMMASTIGMLIGLILIKQKLLAIIVLGVIIFIAAVLFLVFERSEEAV